MNLQNVLSLLGALYTSHTLYVCIPSGYLTLDDLSEVIEAMHGARARWYYIGLQLSLSVQTLNAIRSQFSDATDCLTETCEHWLRHNPWPTWEALTKALESATVGERLLAQELRVKYCQGGEGLTAPVYPTQGPSLKGAPPPHKIVG